MWPSPVLWWTSVPIEASTNSTRPIPLSDTQTDAELSVCCLIENLIPR
jgi:hypothetical protein